MRKLILMAFLLISFCRVAYTQNPNNPVLPFIDEQSEAIVNNAESENSWDGAIVNPIGQFRVLNILINIIYDVTPTLDPTSHYMIPGQGQHRQVLTLQEQYPHGLKIQACLMSIIILKQPLTEHLPENSMNHHSERCT